MKYLLAFALICNAMMTHANDAWLEAGLTEAGREEIRSAFRTAIAESMIAGGGLVLYKNNREIFKEAFGYADIASKRSFKVDTVAHLASTSKPHTSTLIMMLVDDGLIDLDKPVSEYVSEIEDIRLQETEEFVGVPTMRQLLSHTAGFDGLGEIGYGRMAPLIFPYNNFAEATEAIADHGLARAPGTAYRYTQLGMVVAVHVAETVSGKDWETLFQERLAGPIGARHSTWYPSPDILDNMATRYNFRDNKLVAVGPRNPRRKGLPIDPAASLVADMDGVARLFLLHLNEGEFNGKRLLSHQSVKEIRTLQPAAVDYGLGMNLGWSPDNGSGPIIRHGGAAGTNAWADFELEVVGVVFVQTPSRQIPRWSQLIYDALYTAGVSRRDEVMRRNLSGGEVAQ
ncbi:MAG: serine hydrolase domain-containing protein [Pseudomonadales bacterium]